MKNILTVSAMAMSVITGCSQGTPGGPGTTDTKASKPAFGQKDNTFNLSVPTMSSSVQQGEKTEAEVGIKRAKNFDEDVALNLSEVPQGVTFEPASPIIKHGETEVKITFIAGDKAVPGDFKIKIKGHPSKGNDAEIEFKLTVAAKDSFTLSTPLFSTSLKQGETKTVSIGIKRAKTFDQDVALKFGELPTGVTLEPVDPVIKQGDSEAKITLVSADDASLGNFAIKLTGHPVDGVDSLGELKLTVVKP